MCCLIHTPLPCPWQVFGQALDQAAQVEVYLNCAGGEEKVRVPELMVDLCTHIRHNITTEGIFRKAGSAHRQTELKVGGSGCTSRGFQAYILRLTGCRVGRRDFVCCTLPKFALGIDKLNCSVRKELLCFYVITRNYWILYCVYLSFYLPEVSRLLRTLHNLFGTV